MTTFVNVWKWSGGPRLDANAASTSKCLSHVTKCQTDPLHPHSNVCNGLTLHLTFWIGVGVSQL